MITKEDRHALQSIIGGIVAKADTTTAVHAFARPLLAKALTDFVIDATNKFVAGQKEHGGLITDRDLDHEINMEHLDLFWYLAAKQWKNDPSLQHVLHSFKKEGGATV